MRTSDKTFRQRAFLMVDKLLKKIPLKKVVALSLLISMAMFVESFSNADVAAPQKIRVGLLYSDKYNNTAVSKFTVSAEKGLQFGFLKSGTFSVLCEEPSNNIITVRKDAYFTVSNNVLTEYNPTAQTSGTADTSKIGPYHIQIGNSFNDYASTKLQADAYTQLGIVAYPAYIDTWQVWTGFYIDETSLQLDLTSRIKPALGEVGYNTVVPLPQRIVVVGASGSPIFIFGSTINTLQIHPKTENNPYILKINNKNRYRGDLEVLRKTTSDMTVINILTIDQYLYGVVPPEIGGSSPAEALKAQALTAKNYALCRINFHGSLGFDVCNTTECQVYKGYDYETSAANKAVDDTTGKRILYNGKLASTFFFSTSGGSTESVENVWTTPTPYLVSVDDPYESKTVYYSSWKKTLTVADIKTIAARSKDIGDVLGVTITKTTNAGRALEVIIKGTKDSVPYSKERCRTSFGMLSQWYSISTNADVSVMGVSGNVVKTQAGSKNVMTANGLKQLTAVNNNVTIIGADGVKKSLPVIPTAYTFDGKGWGHGVGLSQEGAIGMAKAGFTYDQIIKHYFTGVTIE